MKVWDVFPYWRERWAAEARLRLWADLAPEVTHLPVALVGDRTHRGAPLMPTPKLPDGVEWLWVTLHDDGDWAREAQQRDAVRLLLPRMEPDDLILLCDADEIVDPRVLPAIVAATGPGPVKLRMAMYMRGTRWRHQNWWRHGAACRARDLPEHPTADLRMNFGVIPRVPDGGWHLTYLGTAEDVDAKLSAFAHAEFDTPQTRLDIAAFAGGSDWIDDPLTGPLADLLPELIGVAA